jgi:hypothetical protein
MKTAVVITVCAQTAELSWISGFGIFNKPAGLRKSSARNFKKGASHPETFAGQKKTDPRR